MGGSSKVEEAEVESCAVVFEEYDVDTAGVSKNGSLGALARFVVVVIGGDFGGRGGTARCVARGCD